MKGRREFIKRSGVIAAALTTLPGTFSTANSLQGKGRKKRALRIAHITDVHILGQENARRYFALVLAEINELKDRPDFIINSGDTVMDENEQTRETVEGHWSAWNSVVQSQNKLDMYSAIGNHDVWYGPDEIRDAEYKKDRRYGKQWVIDELKLPSRYYSFSARGWKFIALDSINGTNGYQLDDEQFTWLSEELNDTTLPVLVYSHVPIISMGALLYYTKRKPVSEVKFPRGDMHDDHQRIKDLFLQRNKVRVCLSGHVHYVDGIDYLHVKYFCNGAVSGNWWGEPLALDEFRPVYAILDLFNDGTVEQQLVYYKTAN